MSPVLTVVIGLPGSGKTTLAREMVAASGGKMVMVSRDDIRRGMGTNLDSDGELGWMITQIQEEQIRLALKQGLDVVSHDQNLKMQYRRRLRNVADSVGAEYTQVELTDVPLHVCLDRNAKRDGHQVPEEYITAQYNKYIKNNKNPMPFPEPKTFVGLGFETYVPDTTKPKAVLVDIDGTVAIHEGVRGPYDTSRYHLDLPNRPIINMIQQEAYDLRNLIVFSSGRDEKFREVTMDWLYREVKVPINGLFMRPLNDKRNDAIVKLELFDQNIRNHFNILRCYDDRNRVVSAYRTIGLTVLQVADGDF